MTVTNPPKPSEDVALVGLPNGKMAHAWAQWLAQWLHWYRVVRPTLERPTGLKESDAGLEVFDTTLGKPIWWNGTGWIDISGGGGGGGGVSSVGGSPPVVSSGGANPVISMPAASASVNGYLTAANWTTFNGKANAVHTHAESDVTNLVTDLAAKAPLASPTFTGDPKAPTPTAGDNDTSIATTAFVTTAVAAGGGGAYLPLAGGTLTGGLTISKTNYNYHLTLDSDLGGESRLSWRKDGLDRWTIYKTVYAESGGNTGSDLAIARWNDASGFISDVVKFQRSNGVAIFAATPLVGATAVALAGHTHAQADVTNLVSDLALKAPLASPALTGTPTAPTATGGTNTTQIATTAFVTTAIGAVGGIADAPSDSWEYSRISGAWRQKERCFDLSGLTTLDVAVPTFVKAVTLTGATWLANMAALRLSADGSTFFAGAADYSNVGPVHNSGSGGYASAALATGHGLFLSLTTNSLTLPQSWQSDVTLARPSTSALFASRGFTKNYDTSSVSLYRTYWNTGQMDPSVTTSLTIKAIRFYVYQGGTFGNGSYVTVKWIG